MFVGVGVRDGGGGGGFRGGVGGDFVFEVNDHSFGHAFAHPRDFLEGFGVAVGDGVGEFGGGVDGLGGEGELRTQPGDGLEGGEHVAGGSVEESVEGLGFFPDDHGDEDKGFGAAGEVPEGTGGGEDLIADAGAFDDGMVGGDVDDGSA